MKNKKYIFSPLFLATAFIAGLWLGNQWEYLHQSSNYSNSKAKAKLNKLLDYIDREYVDKVNIDSITNLTVTTILSKLDPHSSYIPKELAKYEEENMKGNFVGIGIQYYYKNDSLTVLKVIEGGPSYNIGILAGDRILKANGVKLSGKQIPNNKLHQLLRGEEGSTIKLEIYRKTNKKKLNFTINRGEIPIKSVTIAEMLSTTIGYVKIERFAANTQKEFHSALVKLKKLKANHIIIDLRDNTGGYMEIATAMADEFLKKGELIVKTKNKKGTIENSFASSIGLFETAKISVLINENSASASEVFAGAIQDNDRGLIYGRRSFGKGLVQRDIKMEEGSTVRLTIAKYYTPSGRSIQKPYEDKGEHYFNEFEKRYQSGELFESDKIKVADSLKFKTKKGRIVYGGGGIIPDIFIPETKNNDWRILKDVCQSTIMSYFVFEQIDKNRIYFNQFNSIEAIKNEALQSNLYFNEFKKYVAHNGLLLDITAYKEDVKYYIFCEMVNQLIAENEALLLKIKKDYELQKIAPNIK